MERILSVVKICERLAIIMHLQRNIKVMVGSVFKALYALAMIRQNMSLTG